MKISAGHIIDFLLKFRYSVLMIGAVITCFFAFCLTRLEVNNDPTRAIPSDLKAKADYERIKSMFPSPRRIILLARFETEDLQAKVNLVTNWRASLQQLEGITRAVSVADLKVPSQGGFLGLTTDNVISERVPLDSEQIRRRIQENSDFTRSFISEDETVFTIVMDIDNTLDQAVTAEKVVKFNDRIQTQYDVETYVTGAPLWTYYSDIYMNRDMLRLLPIALVLMIILLYFIYRRLLYVLCAFIVLLIALIWTFGMMSLIGIPMSVTTSMIPVILMPIGVAGSIHIIKTYVFHRLEGRRSCREALTETYRELTKPVILSSVTTFIGFASFSFSSMTWLRDFGLFTGIGTVLALGITLILLPILISFEKQTSALTFRKRFNLDRIWQPYFSFLFNGRKWAFLFIVILVTGIIGLNRIKVESNPIYLFHEDSEVRQTDIVASENFGGTRFFSIVLTHKTRKLFSTRDWKQVREITAHIEAMEEIGVVSSLTPFIDKVTAILSGRGPADHAVRMLLSSGHMFSGSLDRTLKEWISTDRSSTHLQIRAYNIPNIRYSDTARRISEYVRDNYSDWDISIAGPAVINSSIADLLVETQVSSLLICFFSIFIFLCLLFRSVRMGFFIACPIVLSTIFVYSLMGVFGVSINSVTVILVNTCIGIGIDYAIHFTAGYLYARNTLSRLDALKNAIRNKGTVIMFNTITVGLGFLVLSVSAFPPIRHFGIFVFISMFISSFFSLIFLPILLNIFGEDTYLAAAGENSQGS